MECSKLERRTNVKFLTKLNWEIKQILEALNAIYGNNGPKKSMVYKWITRFRESLIECEDDHGSGRPSTSITEERVAAVRSLFREDRRITIDYMANAKGISRGSANSILVDNYSLSKLSARWVPKALRHQQLDRGAALSVSILNRFETNEEEFLSKIVTGDKTWIYLFDPENKIQSEVWLS
ncbi:protein GVQW3-like [Palaemon carinicauda]|uniref:protein GVQW3-like n=1 Tax=Palaemon carinicauda TaxID=392227 RepID=UPI0035B65AB5